MSELQQAWLQALERQRAKGIPCAVVTVIAVQGSAPREPGARLIVAAGKLAWGTIGGGKLELLSMEHAAGLVQAGEAVTTTERYPLSERAGQCCGGEVTLLYEVFPWRRRSVAIFGAGHVAQALGGLAPWLRADVLLIDPRSEDEIEPRLPEAPAFRTRFIDSPEAEIDTLPQESAVLIMTHDHALDLEVLCMALKRGGFPYLGLIGSQRKWKRFQGRLRQRGFSDEQIASVRCPIGVAKTSKEPTAIAISTAAELLGVLEGLAAPAQASFRTS